MARHVARVGERRNAYSTLVWKREGISQRWEISVKKVVKNMYGMRLPGRVKPRPRREQVVSCCEYGNEPS